MSARPGSPGDAAEVRIGAGDVVIDGDLVVPPSPSGLVIFAHGSGSGRFSERNRAVAEVLQHAGFATLLLDLLTREEEAVDIYTREYRFDIERLGRRVVAAVDWAAADHRLAGLPIGCFGASTGAAAALIAAAERPAEVCAVVSRGGRPDLAAGALPIVRAPTLLIVGGLDEDVIRLNEQAKRAMRATVRLEIVPGATHLFEEPGTLEQVARLARDWSVRYLARAPKPPPGTTVRMLLVVGALASAWAAVGALSPDSRLRPRTAPAEAQAMRAHFDQAMVVHAAVIRGDLSAVAPAAQALVAQIQAVRSPASYVALAALRTAARRAEMAEDALGAARATAEMLVACGTCHRAAGVVPAFAWPTRPREGSAAGHMREHQAAADELLKGLVVPSDTAWRTGARVLATSPLHPRELPVDPARGGQLAQTEERLHRLATDAAQALDPHARGAFYAQFLAACADCHLHR